MCHCQTCGNEELETSLNEWGECDRCSDTIEGLIEAVCVGVEIPEFSEPKS